MAMSIAVMVVVVAVVIGFGCSSIDSNVVVVMGDGAR